MDLGQFSESLEKLPCALCRDVIMSTRLKCWAIPTWHNHVRTGHSRG
jgi:hypothetical protein